jgi:hypothetical protein
METTSTNIPLWRKIGILAVILATFGLGVSYPVDDQLGMVVIYAAIPLVLLIFFFVVELAVRLRVYGYLSTDVDSQFSPSALVQLKRWVILKLGILGAVAILAIGSIVAGITGLGAQHGVQGIVYLTLLLIIGNLIVGILLNADLIKHVRSSKT